MSPVLLLQQQTSQLQFGASVRELDIEQTPRCKVWCVRRWRRLLTNELSEREEMGVRRGHLSGEVGEEIVSMSS